MAPERQNEIWATLTQEERLDFQSMYELKGSSFDNGYNAALRELFGEHNLTTQAGEKLKRRRNGEKKKISEKFPIDYTQYRLDLAKEIAAAGISHQNPPRDLNNFVEGVVIIANEIIKRLKETEE